MSCHPLARARWTLATFSERSFHFRLSVSNFFFPLLFLFHSFYSNKNFKYLNISKHWKSSEQSKLKWLMCKCLYNVRVNEIPFTCIYSTIVWPHRITFLIGSKFLHVLLECLQCHCSLSWVSYYHGRSLIISKKFFGTPVKIKFCLKLKFIKITPVNS